MEFAGFTAPKILWVKNNERYAKFKVIYPACKPLFELIN
jgi:sugar (pentulose or hexulose) kinase